LRFLFVGSGERKAHTYENACSQQLGKAFAMGRLLTLVFVLVLLVSHAVGQTVAQACCGDDHKAHLIFTSGKTKTINPELQQVGCADILVTSDGRTAFWSALVENCCTSYPIATTVVVYTDRHKTVIAPGQMIWRWSFVDIGTKIAVLSGPVHGVAREAGLIRP
jgi:hypothetical protein